VTVHAGRRAAVLLDEIARAAQQLADAGIGSARTDAELIAAHVHGVSRGRLHVLSATAPDSRLNDRFWEDVGRRAAGEPLQHITGRAYFRYLELDVGPGVFVPRPETEVVTGWAVGWLGTVAHPLVADLGTGSGAIALAIAQEVPDAQVHAVEAQRLALAWAERNRERCPGGARVTLHQGELSAALPDLEGAVDLVISNPPYIPAGAWVAPEVGDYDPAEALWGGPDGLDVIRELEGAAARLLRPGGAVVVEHGAPQGDAVRRVFARTGAWRDIGNHRDLAGRDRFVTAERRAGARAEWPAAAGGRPRSEGAGERDHGNGPRTPGPWQDERSWM
jgi:release factor glutamine methyltransferase